VIRWMPVLLAAITLVPAGCGDDGGGASGGQSDEDAVRKAVIAYSSSISERDAAGVCAVLAPGPQQQLIRAFRASDCEAGAENFLSALSKREAADARRLREEDLEVRVEGNRATVTAEAFNGPAPFVKTGGEWKIASFGSD
jgi:hypothetical protein